MGLFLRGLQRRLSLSWFVALALVTGALVAAGLIAGGTAVMAHTNTEAFCVGCHEMGNTVYAEYKGTIHDQNRSGVRATCPDCHVPRELGPLLAAKLRASKDVYGHFISKSISTPEKFEAQRHAMASSVWARMKATDSRECRHCHQPAAMGSALQSTRAQARHQRAAAEKLTCIECHFGIAHKEPAGPGPRDLPLAHNP